MTLTRRSPLLGVALVVALAVPAVATTTADHGDEVVPRYATPVDSGTSGNDTATLAAFSTSTNNNVESVVTAGSSPNPLSPLPTVDDQDSIVTAVDAGTGTELWATRYEAAPFANDVARSLEVDYNNVFAYLVNEADGATTLVELSLGDGTVLDEYPLPGGVNDSAISVSGSWLWAVGTAGGDLQVTGFQTGPDTISLDDQPVAGEAFAADAHHDYDHGNIDTWRTMVVTGQETVFGSGGDAWTGAYRLDRDELLWQRRWASDDDRRDTGLAVDMTWVPGTTGVAFVAGQTFTEDDGFDLWVTALDAQTGAPLWDGPDGMRFIDGDASGDDVPVDVLYVRQTDTVYVTATSERGTPFGEDVLVVAYDATTGDELARAHVGGTISNGDDRPVGISASADGSTIFVGAEIVQLAQPRNSAAVFAFDAGLDPAGHGLLPTDGTARDQVAGVGTSLDGADVLLSGSADGDVTPANTDHVVAAFPTADFVPPTEVSVTASDADASEDGPDDGTFTITRTGETDQPLDVQVTFTGTATNGDDYTQLTSPVTIPANQTSTTITVDVTDDTDVEDTETVVLTVQPDDDYSIDDTADQATVTITDDDEPADAPVVSVTASDADASEDGPDDGTFTITRTGETTDTLDVLVEYSGTATNGDDYTELTSPVTIPANQTSTTITVDVTDDTDVEDTETVVTTVQPDDDYSIDDTADQATVTITDDDEPADAPVVSVTASDADASEDGPDDGAFTITRTGADTDQPLDVQVTFTGTATNGDDHTQLTSPVTIPANQTSTTITVDVTDDTHVEDTETVVTTLQPDDSYTLDRTSDQATVTIADDDAFTVSIAASDADASEDGPDDGTFTITRTGADTDQPLDVQVTFTGTATNGDDYTQLTSPVTIPANQTSTTLTVDVTDDTHVEDTETVVTTLQPDDDYSIDDTADQATVAITDNDNEDQDDDNEDNDDNDGGGHSDPDDDPEDDGGSDDGDADGEDHDALRRLAGDDRVATSVALSQQAFPDGSRHVVLARGDDYPDALTGGPLAFALDAPILLTDRRSLSPVTASELQRLGATTVYLLGGDVALAPQVADDVAGLGVDDVRRVEGADRFATALAIARELLAVGGATTAPDVYVTEGANADPSRGWPDAVSVAPLAAYQARPVLLATQGELPGATVTAFEELGVDRAVVAGGPVAVSDGVLARMEDVGVSTIRVFGQTRYDTSRSVVDLARTIGMDPARTWFATGRDFADALVGGPVIAGDGGVLLLLDGNDLGGSPPVEAWLREYASQVDQVTLLGGPVAISDRVRRQVAAVLGVR